MALHDPIAYTYEADHHCPDCAEERFGRDADGWIGGDAEDDEGNPVGVVAPWDEWWNVGEEGCDTLVCGTCGAFLANAHADECEVYGGNEPCTVPEYARV